MLKLTFLDEDELLRWVKAHHNKLVDIFEAYVTKNLELVVVPTPLAQDYRYAIIRFTDSRSLNKVLEELRAYVKDRVFYVGAVDCEPDVRVPR